MPEYLTLATDKEPRPARAKSTRSFFILAHPEIGDEVRQDLGMRGITDRGVVITEISKAYTKAIAEATEEQLEEFRNLSLEDKASKAEERRVRKQVPQQEMDRLPSTSEGSRKT